MNEKTKKVIWQSIVAALLAGLGIIASAIGLQSCNVTRVTTTKSEFYQKGDTSVTIQTKITESYDATKR